ncbi:hypothetical protein LJR039_007082 [Pseudorhodoferax sp. LjRoot39]|uniref:hypothetical protein n=1 Tax=Pseudorhodoferax sp. LjRoot39 TaxID=3342328 RepID=UPI003ED07B48
MTINNVRTGHGDADRAVDGEDAMLAASKQRTVLRRTVGLRINDMNKNHQTVHDMQLLPVMVLGLRVDERRTEPVRLAKPLQEAGGRSEPPCPHQ